VKAPNITVHQTGGSVNSELLQLDDDPLFHVNEQAVLFLHEYALGQYYVVGGPTGRFGIQAGYVRPTAPDGVKLAEGTTETIFLSSILRAK